MLYGSVGNDKVYLKRIVKNIAWKGYWMTAKVATIDMEQEPFIITCMRNEYILTLQSKSQ